MAGEGKGREGYLKTIERYWWREGQRIIGLTRSQPCRARTALCRAQPVYSIEETPGLAGPQHITHTDIQRPGCREEILYKVTSFTDVSCLSWLFMGLLLPCCNIILIRSPIR